MRGYVPRRLAELARERLDQFPVVAMLGARQCGKTTLAKMLASERPGAVYIDLERRSDRNRLQDPEAFFDLHGDKLVCLDEIQRAPALFEEIRGQVDRRPMAGRFLVLGSATRELIMQGAETLAGRIAHLELTPFRVEELSPGPSGSCSDRTRDLWLRGGFPRAFLARSQEESVVWREEFMGTVLERDLPLLANTMDVERLSRLWQMLGHIHGGLLNLSSLGSSLGISHHTVRSWLGLMEKTFLVRLLSPFVTNAGKRLVKSPRVFLRDTGLLHALLGVQSQDDLLGHPVYGASWEGMVIEHAISALPRARASFYRTRAGAEIDLVLENGEKRIAIECKASTAPTVGKGFWSALADIEPDAAFVVAPVTEAYPLKNGVTVLPLSDLADRLR